MTAASLRDLARLLGGEVAGRNSIRCPAPGHSSRDRSLSVRFDKDAPGGFVVKSFTGSDADFAVYKDHVRERLGLPADSWKRGPSARRERPACASTPKLEDEEQREAFGHRERTAIVGQLKPILGLLGERYLKETRRINVDAIDDVLVRVDAIGWHPWLRFVQPDPAQPLHEHHRKHFGCIVGVMTDPITGEPTGGVSRTFVTVDCKKLCKAKSWGPAGIVRLDEDANVTGGLGLAEGIETALAVMARGFRPVWACGSTALMAKFPILAGISSITFFADHDANGAGLKAAQEAQARWLAAGREARVFMTKEEGDINDLDLRGRENAP